MRASVVILNWNGAGMMRRLLPSVVRCSQMEGVEVVVADNGSTDGSVAMLEAEFPQVRRVLLDRNYGFAEGYNRALRAVQADYYVLLNSDVEIRQQRWLEPMLKYMEAHPQCAACQPKLLAPPDGSGGRPRFEYAGAAGGFLDRYGYPFCRGRVLGTVEDDRGQYDAVVPLLWATGAALMVRSKDFWEAGGLDARFFAHMEEIDLCWHLRSRGRQVVCVSDSVVYHLGGATLGQGHPRKTFLNFRNNLLMLYKNLPEAELKPVMRQRRWLDGLAALKFLMVLDVENFKAVRRARREFKMLRPDFEADRRKNLSQRVVDRVPERVGFSILWQYYVRGARKFSMLPMNKV
mgnify:CR=1 FL=1